MYFNKSINKLDINDGNFINLITYINKGLVR